jgi:hypothetical protein
MLGIASGAIVVSGIFSANRLSGWTAFFLATTVATSVTGFVFHSASFGPPHVIGVISLVVLAVAILALYGFRLVGSWRWIYAAGAVLALYLNVFVGVVQAFQKLPFLQPLAPTQSEPPFIIAQLVVLAIFIVLGIVGGDQVSPRGGEKHLTRIIGICGPRRGFVLETANIAWARLGGSDCHGRQRLPPQG